MNKGLLYIGLFLLISGGVFVLFAFLSGFDIPFGRLPGDINIKKGNASFSFPIVTSIIISIILTIVLNIILRFISKR